MLNKVVWLTPYGQDKLWDPALRLRRVNVHEQFKKLGINSVFIFNCLEYSDEDLLDQLKDADIVVFTEQSRRELNLTKEARKKGILTMRDHCEYIFGFPYQDECFKETDLIICSSTVITQESFKKGYRVWFIPDMWEPTPLCKVRDTSKNLHAVFMGSQGPLRMLLGDYRKAIKEADYELDIISDRDDVGKRWGPKTWIQDYIHADIALCPQDIYAFPGKSNVRVAQALGTGYPIIASPLQSYMESFDGGNSGIIANSPEQWKDALIGLKDPAVRLNMHKTAVLRSNKYSPENISRMWYVQMLLLADQKR
jgi:glycosyltransferase involved in cell wall biosynthesis